MGAHGKRYLPSIYWWIILAFKIRTLVTEKVKEILIRLARKNQPTDVRFHMAIKLLKGSDIDNHISEVLVDTLWNG